MILAIPLFPGAADYDKLMGTIRWQRGTLDHDLVLICREEDRAMMTAFERVRQGGIGGPLEKRFNSLRRVVLPVMPRKGFQVANDMFRTAMDILAATPDPPKLKRVDAKSPTSLQARHAALAHNAAVRDQKRNPWVPTMLFMDPNYIPTQFDWIGTIVKEHHAAKSPAVFGRTTNHKDGGKVFTGPVLFTKEFARTSELLPFLSPAAHWREVLRHEMTKMGAITKKVGIGRDTVLKKVPPCGRARVFKGRTKEQMKKINEYNARQRLIDESDNI
jgi:hypothetical protein